MHFLVVYDPHNEMDEVVSNGYRGKCELKDKKIQNHDAVCGTGKYRVNCDLPECIWNPSMDNILTCSLTSR